MSCSVGLGYFFFQGFGVYSVIVQCRVRIRLTFLKAVMCAFTYFPLRLYQLAFDTLSLGHSHCLLSAWEVLALQKTLLFVLVLLIVVVVFCLFCFIFVFVFLR